MTFQLCRRHAGGPEQLAREGIIIMVLTLLTTCTFTLCGNGFLCWSISGVYLQVPQWDSLSIVNHCPSTRETSTDSPVGWMRLDTDFMSGVQPILPESWKCRADGFPPQKKIDIWLNIGCAYISLSRTWKELRTTDCKCWKADLSN